MEGIEAAGMPALAPRTHRLGATWDGVAGTTFAVTSADAEKIWVVLCDQNGEVSSEHELSRRGTTWSGWVDGARPGQRYAFRAHGAWNPRGGLRFNRKQLLIDPNARALAGSIAWGNGVYGYEHSRSIFERGNASSEGTVPLSVVVDPSDFDWQGDKPLAEPEGGHVIYEAHVKGLTRRLAQVPDAERGKYLGLAHPTVVSHLRRVGATCVELMPVHSFIDQPATLANGLNNYWGYDPLAFSAPEQRYGTSSDPVEITRELKTTIRELHKNGIAVILDVVYNHTAEGNELGPSLSFRGIDNRTWYRIPLQSQWSYLDITGCGNTVDVSQSDVLRNVMDSLRVWAEEYHVDGFRFDEAPVMGRNADGRFDRRSAFFQAMAQDPVLSKLILIAEPWDAAPGHESYKQGEFPAGWGEWNGRFRDCVREFWNGGGTIGELATRITGSADLLAARGGMPRDSVNTLTTHDGFTLRDLVSYNEKHNLANGEDNRDGSNDNRSNNWGAEGPTSDPVINAARSRAQRNMLATLFLSQGTPLLLHGDEIGRTQGGNNNAYNQDNETSWLDWDNADNELLAFVEYLAKIRREHPALTRQTWLRGRTGAQIRDLDCMWFAPDGNELLVGAWYAPTRSLGLLLNGDNIGECNADGTARVDDTLLVLMRGDNSDTDWSVPSGWAGTDETWEVVLDTSQSHQSGTPNTYTQSIPIRGNSIVVLRRIKQI